MNEEYKPINNLWKDSEGYRYFGTLKLSSKIKYDGDDFIPLWEWINQLQQENKILKENAENNDKVVELLKEKNEHLRIQISAREEVCNRLESNWNKLKEYCKENTLCYEVGDDENTKLIGSKIHGLNVLDKMQELERGVSDVED